MNDIFIGTTIGILALIGVLIAYQGHQSQDVATSHTSTSEHEDSMPPGAHIEEHFQEEIYTAEPEGELPIEVIQALDEAINDEYLAHATYDAVIKKLGSVRPFSRIIFAEEAHISMLEFLYDKYEIPVPEDPHLGNIEVKEAISDNCQVGVDAEIANAALYRDNLLPTVVDYPDITDTFERLMNASQDKHLPAFQRCAS